MKYFYFLITLFFLSYININAQEDVITDLIQPNALILNGNDLYYNEIGLGRVSKIDVTETPPTPSIIIEGIALCYTLAINGNDLYILESSGQISKIDMTATTPTPSDVITTEGGSYGMAFNGNDLYISDMSNGKIIKVDFTATTPTATDVFTLTTGVYPTALAFNGNDLYMGLQTGNGSGGDTVSKIDITETTPTLIEVVTGLDIPNGLAFNGNDLYISETTVNKISKIDITAGTTISTDFLTELGGPGSITINENYLYISENTAGKISKIYLGSTASKDDNKLELGISLYPNPAENYLFISGNKKPISISIYNLLGQKLISLENINKVDVKALPIGVYIIKVSDGVGQTNRKFIKN